MKLPSSVVLKQKVVPYVALNKKLHQPEKKPTSSIILKIKGCPIFSDEAAVPDVVLKWKVEPPAVRKQAAPSVTAKKEKKSTQVLLKHKAEPCVVQKQKTTQSIVLKQNNTQPEVLKQKSAPY